MGGVTRSRSPLGLVLYKRCTADQTSITTAHTYLQQDFLPVAGRAYALSTGALLSSTANGDDASLHLLWNSDVLAGNFSTEFMRYSGGTSGYWVERHAFYRAISTVPVSISATAAIVVGTGLLTVSVSQTYLAVVDLGVVRTTGAVISP